MKLVVDLMGADLGVEEVVNGVCDSFEKTKLNFILVGPKENAQRIINKRNIDHSRVEFIDTNEFIENHDDPVRSLRRKKCFVSIGSWKIKRRGRWIFICWEYRWTSCWRNIYYKAFKNVKRATLATLVPTRSGSQTILVDSGAVVDTKPEMQEQFAVMGSVVAEKYLNKKILKYI